jgi:2'-5' RNA ligase
VRLFVAVELGQDVLSRLASLSAELQRRAARHARSARATWVHPERMHLTVRFIGESDADRTAAIAAALAPPLRTPAFDVRIGGTGAFPPRGRPRVLWAGIEQGIEGLQTLEREITERLGGCGVPPEERPYRPHLTLARVREPDDLRADRLFEGLSDTLGSSRVEAITLFHSKTSPKGPEYTALQRTPLALT